MNALELHKFHDGLGARFTEVNRMEAVEHYGDPLAEHAALREAAGLLDLSFRSRLCLTGADRQKFLNGQATNNVKDLKVGEGCYAALVNAKGRMQSDLNLYLLENEILLDIEPGYGAVVTQRLEKYIIADDVQRSEEHTSELQSLAYLVCRLLLEKKKKPPNIGLINLHDVSNKQFYPPRHRAHSP